MRMLLLSPYPQAQQPLSLSLSKDEEGEGCPHFRSPFDRLGVRAVVGSRAARLAWSLPAMMGTRAGPDRRQSLRSLRSKRSRRAAPATTAA